jgi:hypothetical protein
MGTKGVAATIIDLGAAKATIDMPFRYFSPESWWIEPYRWGGPLLVLAGVVYLVTNWWRSYGGRALILSLPIQRWPDFKKWDDRDEFELFEAAALWFDAEPRLPMWWRARGQFQLWKLAISSGAIPINSQAPIEVSEIAAPTTSSVTPHTRIDREALKRLAEKEGRKPLFLFPGRRR